MIMTDYRGFRLSKINDAEFSHLKYLLFWPIYLASFAFLERVWVNRNYHPVHCALDDMIPFCEYFLIPYVLWFVELLLMQLYTLLYDTEEFAFYASLLFPLWER